MNKHHYDLRERIVCGNLLLNPARAVGVQETLKPAKIGGAKGERNR